MAKMITEHSALQPVRHRLTEISNEALRWSGMVLITIVWFSTALFGLYILAFYAAALYEGDTGRWNEVLPGLYETGSVAATSGMGIHFAAGGIILLLGSIQLLTWVRVRFS